MAANAWGTPQRAVEEVFFQNDAVSLCLLMNRRAKTMRVIDFRAGPSNAKRQFVLSLAQREGIEKVYTLVERDEVSTWVKLGFAKEGNVPGFYKRSDAFFLGFSVHEAAAQSEMRLAVANADKGDKGDKGDGEIDPAHAFAERTLMQAKKLAKDLAERPMPAAKITALKEPEAKKAAAEALRKGRALTTFEPFGRDVERRYFLATARGGFELVASIESQSCFGNTYLELLTGPRNEVERMATVSSLRALCDKFLAEGISSCFSLTPSDDLGLALAYVASGFRRTGLLPNHVVVGAERKDAIIWSRKLANPTDD